MAGFAAQFLSRLDTHVEEYSLAIRDPNEADPARSKDAGMDIEDRLPILCLLFIHPRAPNLINLRSASTMPA